MTQEFLTLLTLILISATFSAAEIAVVSLSSTKLKLMEEDEKFGSKAILKIKKEPQNLLISILIGNQITNVFATVLATIIGIELLGEDQVGPVTIIFSIILILFTSLLPKTIALNFSETISRVLAYPLLGFIIIIKPLTYIAIKTIDLLTPGIDANKNTIPTVTQQEIEATLDLGSKGGLLQKDQEKLIRQALNLQGIKVEGVMTILKNMQALNRNITKKELKETLLEGPQSHYPIFDKDLNSINGTISLKEAIDLVINTRKKFPLKQFKTHPLTIVPKTNSLSEIFKIFKKKGQSIALVVDEHGQTVGIISSEDILREISKIPLENGKTEKKKQIEKIGKKLWKANGEAGIKDINEELDVKIDFPEENSISLLILETLKRFPKKKEVIKVGKLDIQVSKSNEKSIEEVQIKKTSRQIDKKKKK